MNIIHLMIMAALEESAVRMSNFLDTVRSFQGEERTTYKVAERFHELKHICCLEHSIVHVTELTDEALKLGYLNKDFKVLSKGIEFIQAVREEIPSDEIEFSVN